MWEIVAGMNPYWSLDNAQVVDFICFKKQVLSEPSIIASGALPKVLYEIMKKCWTFNPQERPSFDSLNKEFKELDKEVSVNSNTTVMDNTDQDSYQLTNYGNVTREEDKKSRYCKISATPSSSGSDNSTTSTITTYGNKVATPQNNNNDSAN